MGMANTEVPEIWTNYSATITTFRPGTAFVRIGWFDHYGAGQTALTEATNNKIYYTGITFGLNTASQVDIDNIFSDNTIFFMFNFFSGCYCFPILLR